MHAESDDGQFNNIHIYPILMLSSCAKAKCSSYFPLWTTYVGCCYFVLCTNTNFLDRMTQFKWRLQISLLM